MAKTFRDRLESILQNRGDVKVDIPRSQMIREALAGKEAWPSAKGALATWTPPESTGRSPLDTVIVRRPSVEKDIDWDAPNNIPLDPETFDMILEDTFAALKSTPRLYRCDRVIGADPAYAMPVDIVTSHALHALFADNMFRPASGEVRDGSLFKDRPFTMISLPYHKLDAGRYEGRLRKDPRLGHCSTMVVAMDFELRIGVIVGSAYCGSAKKLLFTAMNFYLPAEGILPLHCSANEGPKGDSALLLGLSGTGKTTLSADPDRALLGDDEHGWSDGGVANFENGCYAKLIDLDPKREPEIHRACFTEKPVEEHGAIIENAMMWPDGSFDLYDDRLTPNSRGSYPLSYLGNFKPSSMSGHPETILFLTADANGVIPPISKLDRAQAMLWFLMGYTSKLAGTETGIVDPVSTFSRFFGAPFMPRNPDDYASLLGKKLDRHRTRVFLVNTGWSGGPYGEGERMDLPTTRAMVDAALVGGLDEVDYEPDPIFKVGVPKSCPGVADAAILAPINTWKDKTAFRDRARKLAGEFAARFDKVYGDKGLDPAVEAACPGK